MQVTREGIPTGLLSIPIRYMHTAVETVVLADIDRTARLWRTPRPGTAGGGTDFFARQVVRDGVVTDQRCDAERAAVAQRQVDDLAGQVEGGRGRLGRWRRRDRRAAR